MNGLDVAAAVAANARLLGLGSLPDNTEARLAVALAFWQEQHGLEPDGAYDRATEESLNTARAALELAFAEAEPVVVGPSATWPAFDWGIAKGTSRRAALGPPGPPESAWKKTNIISLKGFDTRPGGYTSVHRKVKGALLEAKRRSAIAAPNYEIERCGGYNFRHMRHDPNMPLSVHASGGAVDINANENFAKTYGIDEDGPEPWTSEWMETWPDGMPRAFVEAWESVGWRWGGRWRAPKGKRGFRDPQHLEAPRTF